MQVWVQMGWWGDRKEAYRGICSKICRVFNGLDRSSARGWVHLPSKNRYTHIHTICTCIWCMHIYMRVCLFLLHNFAYQTRCFFMDSRRTLSTELPRHRENHTKTSFPCIWAYISLTFPEDFGSRRSSSLNNICLKHFVLFTLVIFFSIEMNYFCKIEWKVLPGPASPRYIIWLWLHI